VPTWKLTLEYDGTSYSGWQEQLNAPKTILGRLRQAAEEVFGAPVELQGAGRTDSGVHALGQVAHLRVEARRTPPPHTLLLELNQRLPADIAVVGLERAPDRFHARHDATRRTYLYRLATAKGAFSKRYTWWVKQPLDVEAMRRAAALFAGRHDFICFRAADPSRPGESTLVVVEACTVETEESNILIRIVASHFLWRMVRRMVGVLVKVGLGELAQEDVAALLNGRCKQYEVASWTAPASGLFLESIDYE
jgi:tRNA pseudouridine38-40 synthase